MTKDSMSVQDSTIVGLIARPNASDRLGLQGRFHIECRDANGEVKWVEDRDNTVVNTGKNDALTNWLKGSAYTAANFLGLIDNASFSAIAAGDTMASHAGWLESTAYSNATRIAPTWGTASAGSIDNSASPAAFTINATATINGVFMTTNSTKGGTTGTLLSAVSFGATRSVASGDTLNVTYTMTG